MVKLLELLIQKYPNLNKMDHIYVDWRKKVVTYRSENKKEPILQTHAGKYQDYKLDDETMRQLSSIIASRCKMNEISDSEKIESELKSNHKVQKTIIKELSAKIEAQNAKVMELQKSMDEMKGIQSSIDEIKVLLQQCTIKKKKK